MKYSELYKLECWCILVSDLVGEGWGGGVVPLQADGHCEEDAGGGGHVTHRVRVGNQSTEQWDYLVHSKLLNT